MLLLDDINKYYDDHKIDPSKAKIDVAIFTPMKTPPCLIKVIEYLKTLDSRIIQPKLVQLALNISRFQWNTAANYLAKLNECIIFVWPKNGMHQHYLFYPDRLEKYLNEKVSPTKGGKRKRTKK